MFNFRKPTAPYSMEEAEAQIASLIHLSKLRDAALQKAVTYSNDSDVKAQKYLEEVDRYIDMIDASQHVYSFMMQEVEEYLKQRKGK